MEFSFRFMPERWLRSGDHQRPHPFTHMPFGWGPRMCPAMRLAELEIKVAVIKVLQNFRIEWAGEKPLGPRWQFLNKPNQPVKIKFNRLN